MSQLGNLASNEKSSVWSVSSVPALVPLVGRLRRVVPCHPFQE